MNVIEPPDRDGAAREEQAAHFSTLLRDNASPAAQLDLERWLMEDPRNAVAFARIGEVLGRLTASRPAIPAPAQDDHPRVALREGQAQCSQQ